jgi:hypothetical protein
MDADGARLVPRADSQAMLADNGIDVSSLAKAAGDVRMAHFGRNILCKFRFVNPKAEIRMAGGREGHLRGLQSLALYPANSLFVDGYLATRGDGKAKVFQMIEDAGSEVDGDVESRPLPLTSAQRYAIDDDANMMNPKTAVVEDRQR